MGSKKGVTKHTWEPVGFDNDHNVNIWKCRREGCHMFKAISPDGATEFSKPDGTVLSVSWLKSPVTPSCTGAKGRCVPNGQNVPKGKSVRV